jgi:hypothetical protein
MFFCIRILLKDSEPTGSGFVFGSTTLGGRAGDVEGKESLQAGGLGYSQREEETKRNMEIETEEQVHLFLFFSV